ncbi:hypothetical protein [Actinoalloteichus spitiensis]|uniref:hypothetical protein n=1 Tax=Actinoalloteichus spitiensis TaxID=252394 RepID=UPI00036FBF9A|nr:hypothetical protein [Actinoalloteichus spitiensis]
MVEEQLELLVTVVVAAGSDRHARDACDDLIALSEGAVVGSWDCSHEEPGCWALTISRRTPVHGGEEAGATLGRAVRRLLRALGPGFTASRLSCEPPTAWTVVDDPELIGSLVPGGERILVEAWLGESTLPALDLREPETPDPVEPPAPAPTSEAAAPPPDGPLLALQVDVLAERSAGAQWQARAIAGRLTSNPRITDTASLTTTRYRVRLDLGRAEGDVEEAVLDAVRRLGKSGWSEVARTGSVAVMSWSTTSTPRNGIVGLEVSARQPEPGRVEGPEDVGWRAPAPGTETALTGSVPEPEPEPEPEPATIGDQARSRAEELRTAHRSALPREEQHWSWWG